ncbi:hypothetical protein MFLAVUS_009003 [Mucor flavus]|uniref:Uncharacterized protein n=1 Tax=Mucor flavus TaxID=439312 RepID=A0ABP9Z8T4_9FUNG
MFFDNKPPIPTSQDEFPSFDTVVNVSNCWYYLSLLERFVDITSSLSQKDLKIYLVRAEYRYFKWMFANVKDRQISLSIPPVDVAFFWQAHMLSPLRFQEDIMRLTPFTSSKIPLKEIHEMYKNYRSPIRENWGRLMSGEPYELTKKELLKKNGYANVTCIVCNSCIQSPWEDYAEWRTDHTMALKCHCCYAMFTVKHVGKANLFLDNAKPYKIAGLTMNAEGIPFKDSIPKTLLDPTQDIKSLPFNEGLKPLDKYFEKKLKVSTPSNTMIRKKVIDAIQSTYLCTPYRGSSIDLIQAVARQYKFAVKATKKINWDVPQGIIRGIRHYASFLAIIKENKGLTAVPTYEIDLSTDLAWHTHMLHYGNYNTFCSGFIGKIINHDDTIPEKELENYVKKTDMAWQARNEKREMASSTHISPVAPVVKPVVTEEKRESSFKIKLKLILSASKSKTDISPENIHNQSTRKNKYVDEKSLFGDKYTVGTYRTTPPYKRTASVSNGSEKNDADINIADYDTEKISFHDKSTNKECYILGDIQEFITLKNSDQLMDEKFEDVKKSVYGFIGTSTCGNTDYLNQWSSKEENKDDDGKNPMFDFKNGTLKSNRRRFKNFQDNRATRNQAQSGNFNWHLVSIAWSDSYVPNCDNNKSSRGGGVTRNNKSSCGVFWSSTAYGGGSASCGGGSSSCGSSCGGGGCGGS